MNAIAAAVLHVRARLAADPTVTAAVGDRIFHGVASAGATHPLVLMQTYTDPLDTLFNGTKRALTTVTFTVRVVAPVDSIGPLVPIAAAVNAALDGSTGKTAHGLVAACYRVAETEMAEVHAGRTVRYLGGRYELIVS